MSAISETAESLARPLDGHSAWAAHYDEQPNPVTALQERTLRALLPNTTEKTVLDLGCGTGRILRLWRETNPCRLIGLDFSRSMLERADTQDHCLIEGDCCQLPFADATVDAVSCCLTLGYLTDFGSFVRELSRIVTPEGLIFISELHPTTARHFGWQRGFSTPSGKITVPSCAIPIEQVMATFSHSGFEPELLIEPAFEDPERKIFDFCGRFKDFERFRDFPAIYILRLRRSTNRQLAAASHLLTLTSARVALGATAAVKASLTLDGDHLVSFGVESQAQQVNLSEYMILPGMINAHDHLDFGLFPRLGRGGYRNSREWAEDIHRPNESPTREHLSVPKWVRLWWGGIRNLIAGVTSVCNHNPYEEEVFNADFPVRVIRDFSWAHSLHFDRELVRKHHMARKDQPFVVHLAEGIDCSSATEIFALDRDGVLDSRTVVVHGCGLDNAGLDLLQQRGASLVWCPSSNDFLFGQTLAAETVESLPLVALGSDSPLTAGGDFLDEIRFAHKLGLHAKTLFELVTSRPNRILRLKDGEGKIEPRTVADLIAIRDRHLTAAETLAALSYHDIELVIVGGKVRLVSEELRHRFPVELTANLELLVIDGERRWIAAPVNQLLRFSREALGSVITMYGRTLTQ